MPVNRDYFAVQVSLERVFLYKAYPKMKGSKRRQVSFRKILTTFGRIGG
jgi:hypothetical protein